MGWFSPDLELSEEKLIDSNGHVNNNIIIQEARDTHQQAILSEHLLYGMYVLITFETIKLGICTYNMWKRRVKKYYTERNNNP